MSRSRRYFAFIHGFVLVVALGLSQGAAHAQAAGSFGITGAVTDSSSNAVSNASVTATNPGGTTVEFGPSSTASDGTYELDVDPGTYDIHFQPPSGSPYNPVVERSGYPVKVATYSGGSTNTASHYLVQIFAVGSDPDMSSPIYQASGNLTGGQINVHP